ncbi:hypothetical protein GCM10022243_43410 [Saccharothrix violaceirubra]|uniref:Uncharacterized protein n=1 Tax=Saccharothrix violaceirubra TaxID=413306 RepID=A0A7W7WWI5_9PSEU|nr:hypothetical protein [Saccharothrix violaceirubra]MBB4965628.1 hypothetical protein [Saccharothrix violaceirubra]
MNVNYRWEVSCTGMLTPAHVKTVVVVLILVWLLVSGATLPVIP